MKILVAKQIQKFPSIFFRLPPHPPPKGEKIEGKKIFGLLRRFGNSTKGDKVITMKPFAPYPCDNPRRNTMRSALRRRQICMCLPRNPREYTRVLPTHAHTTTPAILGKIIKWRGLLPLIRYSPDGTIRCVICVTILLLVHSSVRIHKNVGSKLCVRLSCRSWQINVYTH